MALLMPSFPGRACGDNLLVAVGTRGLARAKCQTVEVLGAVQTTPGQSASVFLSPHGAWQHSVGIL